MRDFPFFNTEFGVASLVLRDVPYWKKAYIKLHSSTEPDKLLKECVDFCKAVGAEQIFASGHDILQKYPTYASLVKMQCRVANPPQTDAIAVPVTEQQLPQWKEIYNQKMAAVPNASYIDDARARELLAEKTGYMIYKQGVLAGIGKASGNTIHAVASVMPGAGKDIVCALVKTLAADTVDLLVALENTRAIALYERLGFETCEVVSKWHQIL